jgi:2',3'-cyclic-nucleotide 2'-phosphodiesterase (5'-nucleotidase family)
MMLAAVAHGEPASFPVSQPTSQPTSQPSGPSLSVIYTGGYNGLTYYHGTGSTIVLLWDELAARGGSTWIERSGTGGMRLGRRRLLDIDGLRGGKPMTDLLRRGVKRRRVLSRELKVLESDHTIVFQYPPDPHFDLLKMMEQRNRRTGEDPSVRIWTASLTELENRAGEKVLLLEPKSSAGGSLRRDPLAWEPQWLLRGKAALGDREGTYYLFTRPHGDGARRVRLIKDLAAATRPDHLLVNVGNTVSTFARLSGKKSPIRALDFETLAKLGFHAVAPGKSELYYGVEELRQQARRRKLPLVATNLYFKEGPKKGKSVFPRYLIRRVGDIHVGIIGLVNRDAVERAPFPKLVAGIEVRDPVESAVTAIREMQDLPGKKPQLVVALSNLRGKDLHDAREIYGVDLFITHQYRWGRHPAVRRVDARRRSKERIYERTPLLHAYSHGRVVGRADIRFGGRPLKPRSLVDTPYIVHPDLPRDEHIHRQLTRQRLTQMGRLQSVLLPSLEAIIGKDEQLLDQVRADPEIARFTPREQTKRWRQLWFTARLWSIVVANILRRAAGTEIALTKRATWLSTNVPGPVLESYVLRWLSDEDNVRVYELTGAQLQEVAKAAGDKAVVTGFDLKASKVAGRTLSNTERYEVAVSSQVAELEPVAAALRGIKPETHFFLEDERLEPDPSGNPTRLREVVMATLRGMRARHPEFDAGYRDTLRGWLRPAGEKVEPRWTVAARGITVSFANYSNHPRSSYLEHPEIRETRTQMPNNYSLGLRGELAAGYDSADINWTNTVKFKLARLMIDLEDIGKGEIENETADDLTAATELQLKFLQLKTKSGLLGLVPYLNVTFDTEFTATKHLITSETYPHQKELYASAGLVLHPGRILQEVRLAGLTKTDFVPDKGKFEAGLLAGARVEVPLWKAALSLGATVRYFPDTDSDTLEDLGLILEGEAALKVPFTRDFSLSLGADLFLYQPKLRDPDPDDDTNPLVKGETAVSLILNAGLTFDHLWKW